MHPALLAVLAVLLVVVVVAVVRSRAANRRPLATAGERTREPSIYQQVRAQLQESPGGALDVSKIRSDDPAEEGRVRFAPGAVDAIFGPGKEADGGATVLDVIRKLSRGEVGDWTAVDAVVGDFRAASNVDHVIRQLRASDVTPRVRERFWELALKSRRTESVKWGIAIAGIGLRKEELETLLELAHHAEFTLFAAHVLMREGAQEPSYRRKLVELLPSARQWGVIHLIDYIVVSEDLIVDADVQRDVLLYGMEHNDGIPMEVAFTIAKAVDVPRLIAVGRDDHRVRRAITSLMHSLLTEPRPLGGLADLDGWEGLYDAWVQSLEQRDSDTLLLGSLRSLKVFLTGDKPEWGRRKDEQDRIAFLWREKFSLKALREGLGSEIDHWLALQIIAEQGVRELLPDVRQVHMQKPEYCTIDVLAKLGNEEDLEFLRASISKLVDVEARKRFPLSSENVYGPRHRNVFEYGHIVRAMGRLATPAAVATIKCALIDYDPHIRAAACDAVAKLGKSLVDDEIRSLVQCRLKDSPDYVAEAARAAAGACGLMG